MKIKKRILTKARKMFVKQGIRAITMDHIADQMGISKRTIYVNFKDKNDLIINCVNDAIVTQKTKDDQIISDTPNCLIALIKFMEHNIASVKAINPCYFHDLEKYYPKIWESKIKEIDDYRYKRLIDLLNKGVSNRIYRKDIDIEIVAITIQNIFKSICSPVVYPITKHSQKLVFPNAIINYTRGIVNEIGMEYLESNKSIKPNLA